MPLRSPRPDIEAAGSPRRPPTVLIADAHAPARSGVRRALAGGFTVVAEATDADEAVALAVRERPDVCLIEVVLPGGGVKAARQLAASLPDTAVVMLTLSTSEDDFLDSLRAGVAGYLLKDLDPGRLPHALEGVLAGESAIPRRLLPRLMEAFRHSSSRRMALDRRRGPSLTAREWEVAELLREGLSTSQVAARLHVSPVTVRRHRSAVSAKLGAAGRPDSAEGPGGGQ
jgi:DNA-binding NarL/FixJ family response regulator